MVFQDAFILLRNNVIWQIFTKSGDRNIFPIKPLSKFLMECRKLIGHTCIYKYGTNRNAAFIGYLRKNLKNALLINVHLKGTEKWIACGILVQDYHLSKKLKILNFFSVFSTNTGMLSKDFFDPNPAFKI